MWKNLPPAGGVRGGLILLVDKTLAGRPLPAFFRRDLGQAGWRDLDRPPPYPPQLSLAIPRQKAGRDHIPTPVGWFGRSLPPPAG